MGAELNPDVNVDDPAAWDFQFLILSPTWTFDKSSLLWPHQKWGDVVMINNLVTVDGLEHIASIKITDYVQDGAVNPVLAVSMGYNNGQELIDLDGKPSSFTVSVKQVVDNTYREEDSIADGIDYQSVYFRAKSSIVASNSMSLRIQRFSIKNTRVEPPIYVDSSRLGRKHNLHPRSDLRKGKKDFRR